MAPSKELFELIHSLSGSEKIYFKKFSSLHELKGENKYILLFDAIAAQKEYDEPALIQKFKGKAFATQFSAAKNYLYNQILKSLRAYHHTFDSEIKNLLRDIELLYEKGLYEQAYKKFKKTKLLAKENEMYWVSLELFKHWEYKFLFAQGKPYNAETTTGEEEQEISLLQNIKTYRDIYFKVVAFYFNHGIIRNKQQQQEIDKIMANKMLKDISFALTFNARVHFFDTYYYYALTKGDIKGSMGAVDKIISLFESSPVQVQNNTFRFIGYLHNQILTFQSNKIIGKIPPLLAKLEAMVQMEKTPVKKTKSLFYIYSHRLNYYIGTGLFDHAVLEIPAVSRELEKHESLLNGMEKITFYANIAEAYFGQNKFKPCLFWLNKIRNEPTFSAFHPEVETFLRLFYIIIHFESGNTELLPSLTRSLYRFLKKRQALYKFETIVLDFFNKDVPKNNNRKELLQAFGKLKNKLIPLEKDPYERNALEQFDYISWLESKVKKCSFADAVMARHGTNASEIKKLNALS